MYFRKTKNNDFNFHRNEKEKVMGGKKTKTT